LQNTRGLSDTVAHLGLRFKESARIGSRRILLWSGLVVSRRSAAKRRTFCLPLADALHAASMLMLAVVDRTTHRTALTDAMAEAVFAAAGLAAATAYGGGTPAQPRPRIAATALPAPGSLPVPRSSFRITASWP
jgi:hypothetical protein